jgi:hypothetical protein
MRYGVIDTDIASLLQMQQAPPWALRHLAGHRDTETKQRERA